LVFSILENLEGNVEKKKKKKKEKKKKKKEGRKTVFNKCTRVGILSFVDTS
jgi:hypothetical protein